MATQTSLVAQQVRIASPQTWVLAMKNPRILRGLRRFYRNDQDH